MDCFQDFCLYCDRDSPDGPYCSQQCKLSDLERASHSNPSSPTSPTAHRSDRSWPSTSTSNKPRSGHSHHHSTPGYGAPPTSSGAPRSSYFMWNPSHQVSEQGERQLTPSSSRTSLSSTTSTSSTPPPTGISAQAQQQLQEYFSSFDQAKAAKRRSSLRY